MSQNYSFSTGPFNNLLSPGPATVEEYNSAGGNCLGDAVDNVIFRSHIPEFWDKMAAEVEKATGIKREVDAKATARARDRAKDASKIADVLEKPIPYAVRAFEASAEDVQRALTSKALEVAASLKIDVSPGRRSGGIGAKFLAQAEDILSRDDAGVAKAVGKCDAAAIALDVEFTLERDENGRPVKESLAAYIKAITEAMR